MRHEIFLQVVRRSDNNSLSSSYRIHLVTLANEKAVGFIERTFVKGTLGWKRGLGLEDIFEYRNEKKDAR